MKHLVIVAVFALSLFGQANAATPRHDSRILFTLIKRAQLVSQRGGSPLVIFDLDDTLITTRERTLRILRELAQNQDAAKQFPQETSRLQRIQLENIEFQLADTLANVGIHNSAFLDGAQQFWLKRFFSDEYCALDQPTRGAAEYLQALAHAGVKIVYLTGRDIPRMRKGTVYNLQHNGFPGPRQGAVLLMKPDPKTDDLEFKKQALGKIFSMGDVVGVAENEPANLNAMMDAFSDATGIFLDTIHSPKPDVPAPGAHWLYNFDPR